MTDTSWQPDLARYGGPKFRALARALREAILSGQLPPGARLPAVRDLAWRLRVTPGTVARAYQIAAAEGIVDSHVGRGSFVAAPRPRFGPMQSLLAERVTAKGTGGHGPVDLRIPQLPDCGQLHAISAALRRTADRIGPEILDYPPLDRDRDCREALVGWLADRQCGPFDAGDIVLAHGGQNAISLVLSLCLTGDRPRLLAEALTYPGLRHLARQHRAEITAVPLDGQGMQADALDRAVRSTGARLVCISPTAQNPTTVRMTAARRAEIVAVARHHDLQIIEDAFFSCPSGPGQDALPSLRAMAPERVWHVASLSKTLAAGLRFGTLLCPQGMGEAGRLAAQHSFFGVALPMTMMITELVRSGELARLTQAVQQVFERRTALARLVLAGTDLQTQPGLPLLWMRLPARWRASAFVARAADQGVLIRSADEFAAVASGAPAQNAVRIGLSGQIEHDRLESALRILARLYASPPGDLAI